MEPDTADQNYALFTRRLTEIGDGLLRSNYCWMIGGYKFGTRTSNKAILLVSLYNPSKLGVPKNPKPARPDFPYIILEKVEIPLEFEHLPVELTWVDSPPAQASPDKTD
jgi:hypothetical protein